MNGRVVGRLLSGGLGGAIDPAGWMRGRDVIGMRAMILEAALLDVIPGREAEFERAFAQASPVMASAVGYMGHSLTRCLERPSKYLLLVRWRTLEDHTRGFRGSTEYQEWKRLLHHFYEPFPTVEHFAPTGIGPEPTL